MLRSTSGVLVFHKEEAVNANLLSLSTVAAMSLCWASEYVLRQVLLQRLLRICALQRCAQGEL